MFRKNKAIKEYKNSIDKIKIPNLRGEEYISVSPKKEINILPIIKRSSIAFAAICALSVFNFMSSSKLMNTDFTIKAYAGTNTVELKSGQEVELPSGWIEKDTYNMQGLLIECDNISKVTFDIPDKGQIKYIRTGDNYPDKTMLCIGMDSSTEIPVPASSPGLLTAKITTDEVVNELDRHPFAPRNLYGGEELREALGLSYEEMEEYFNNCPSSSVGKSTCVVGEDNYEFTSDSDYKKHYILWVPEIQFLRDISEGKEINYSSVEDVNIKFTITFKDDSTVTKTLHLSFNENGNLNCELN